MSLHIHERFMHDVDKNISHATFILSIPKSCVKNIYEYYNRGHISKFKSVELQAPTSSHYTPTLALI